MLGVALAWSSLARAEVPGADAAHGREFRVDFSARHLGVDSDLGELSLSGDVVVSVGRYRLSGQRVRLQRGPTGIKVRGGGEIAFCRCEAPPVTLGYSSVTLAPPSDVVIEDAVLRAGPLPLLWLPYLWLRSPDRLSLAFPSAEWRGEDGLLVGTGLHVPFSANQGRPPTRALDVGVFGYLQGGARVDAKLLTPQSTSYARWDHIGQSALLVDAHGSSQADSSALLAYDVDLSRGARGRRALTELDAAARRYDHARVGAASAGHGLFAVGGAFAAERAAPSQDPGTLGPFAMLATGGGLGASSSYALDVATEAWTRPVAARATEGRALARGVLESALLAGPLALRAGAFQQAELLSQSRQAVTKLVFGAAGELSLPLVRRFAALTHSIAPRLSGRIQRLYLDERAASQLVTTAGFVSALGSARSRAAASVSAAAGVAGDLNDPKAVVELSAGSDAPLLGLRLAAIAEPGEATAEATARLRLGRRQGTNLSTFAEARSQRASLAAALLSGSALAPRWQELPGYVGEGLTTGAELSIAVSAEWAIWIGADLDPMVQDLLAARSGGAYRHDCGCFAVSASASERIGRGGFDARLSLDLMP